MICPECNHKFERSEGSCPRCGEIKGVVKTSTILISAGGTRKVYRSVEEVPGPLRKRLLRSTNGLNSATIVIADRQGRREIAKAIKSLPVAGKAEKNEIVASGRFAGVNISRAALRSVGLILLATSVAIVWAIFR